MTVPSTAVICCPTESNCEFGLLRIVWPSSMAISLSGAGSKIATDSESEPKDARLTPSRLRTLSRAQAR
jgi:hypothetical protein